MASSSLDVAALSNTMSCHERHNRNYVDAVRSLLTQVDESSKSLEKMMEATRQYCSDVVLIEHQCSTIPLLTTFSTYSQRSAAAHKSFGDCISVSTIDQLRTTRKATKADFDEAMKNFKSTELEVSKKDKKLKDIENSKSAANQRSTIDTLSRQLHDERKALGSMREHVVQVGQRCVEDHEKGSKAAIMSFLHSAMAHHAAMLQLTTEAYQEISKLQ